jgi:tartrate dehydrogenase/decarboxylase/D-malate dehydrogenase
MIGPRAKEAAVARSIAVIPGDGIGPEVIAAARPILTAALGSAGDGWRWDELDWNSERYLREGAMMPADAFDVLRRYDGVYFGAVGDPRVADHIPVWGLVLAIRREFDLYVNLRPIRWLPGVPGTLANRQPADVDMVFVRENTEGEYSDLGHRDTDAAEQVARFTRAGTARVARYAFDLARSRGRGLISVTKSNALRHSMVFWDEVVAEVAAGYPDVPWRSMLVDAAAYEMVMNPAQFSVVLASNLFGDILTDLGAALQGSLGLAASGNIGGPAGSGAGPAMFEPIHGSAPPLAGRGIANPSGAIWAGAMMLEHLGERAAADRVLAGLSAALAAGHRTADLGGSESTGQFADAVLQAVLAGPAGAAG